MCSPGSLSFLGDAVWEMHVRRKHLLPGQHLSKYYHVVRGEVCAEAQASLHDALQTADVLTAEERDVLRWGSNATGTVPRRLAGGKLDRLTYRKATSLECLLGYLHTCDPDRCLEVMHAMHRVARPAGEGGVEPGCP